MSAQTDWKSLVETYAAGSEQKAEAVESAQARVHLDEGSPEYWEALRTLARQAVAMAGTREAAE